MSQWKVVTEDDVKAGLAQLSKPRPKWHKQDYEMVAGILASTSDRKGKIETIYWHKGRLVDAFIEVFGADNPAFDMKIFRNACEDERPDDRVGPDGGKRWY